MQSIVDSAADVLVYLSPAAQEFYLFIFFCLGFYVFRTKVVRGTLLKIVDFIDKLLGARPSAAPKLEKASKVTPNWSSVEQLRNDFARRRYEEVIRGWPCLEKYTSEALTLVTNALLALGRPEEIGIFIAKSVVNLPHLRSTLHETIVSVAMAPFSQVPRLQVEISLRDIYQSARGQLDHKATEALLVALSRLNDEQRVNNLLCGMKEHKASPQVLAELVQGFLACGNFDAAIGYLSQAFAAISAPSTPGRVAVNEAAIAASRSAVATSGLEDVNEKQEKYDQDANEAHPLAGSRIHDILEVFDSAVSNFPHSFPEEAVILVLEHVARLPRPDIVAVEKAENVLRKRGTLPPGALDALVRAEVAHGGCQRKAVAYFDELVHNGTSNDCLREERSPETPRIPTEGSVVGMLGVCAEFQKTDIAEHILEWARTHNRCSLPVFSAVVKVYVAAKCPERVCSAFESIVENGGSLEMDDAMYGQIIRCAVQVGRLDLARRLFYKSNNPDAQNSASMIRLCGQEGEVRKATDMLFDLHARGEADTATFNSALDAAICNADQEAVTRIFEEMKRSRNLDVVSFNILLKRCLGSDARSISNSKALLEEMREFGLSPNIATYNSLLGGFAANGDFPQVWRTIDKMENGPGIDAYTLSILFKGYKNKRQTMDEASFDKALTLMSQYAVKVDEVLVNTALEACFTLRDPYRVASTMETIRKTGWAISRHCSMHTYASLIKAHGMNRQLSLAWKLWEDVTTRNPTSQPPSEHLYSQMIDVLVSNGRLNDAARLFQDMKAARGRQSVGSHAFSVAYALLIRGYAQRKECSQALSCYDEMKRNGAKVGLVILNTLVDACCRVGDMSSAAQVFRDMVGADCTPDLITYSTLIKGYCVRGEMDEAIELFSCMRQKGIVPDAIVFNSLLDGAAKKQLLKLCEQIVYEMEEAGLKPSNHSLSILIKLYGREHDVEKAFDVFKQFPLKYGFRPNAAVFTCLMSTCISNGQLQRAFDLLTQMVKAGQKPDEKTFSTLLRGSIRSQSVESVLELLRVASEFGACETRHLLDEELVQSGLQLIHRKGFWPDHGREALDRLREAGVVLRQPSSSPDLDCRQGGVAVNHAQHRLGGRKPRRPVAVH